MCEIIRHSKSAFVTVVHMLQLNSVYVEMPRHKYLHVSDHEGRSECTIVTCLHLKS